jgi:DNA recombination protein RmuC
VLDGVILFLPADAVLEAALRRDSQVLQHAASRRVHLVTPTTLLVTLSVVEQLWRQDGRDRRADEIEQLGTDTLERMSVVIGHVARLQRHLSDSVAAYNGLTASLESRLLPVVRRLEELGVRARDNVPSVTEIDTLPRELGPRLESVRASATASNPDGDSAPGEPRAAA